MNKSKINKYSENSLDTPSKLSKRITKISSKINDYRIESNIFIKFIVIIDYCSLGKLISKLKNVSRLFNKEKTRKVI